jgi:hypothetical protein
MERGFLYLTAIIDVYSRYIVGWSLSNTLDAECSLNVFKRKHSTKPLFPISTKQTFLQSLDNLAHLGQKLTVR